MQHARFVSGEVFPQPISKVVCVGRNYAEHAKELNNPVPTTPILFIKPNSAVVPMAPEFALGGEGAEVHYEAELAILVGQRLSRATPEAARAAIAGLGLALDLTLRDVQSDLKSKGLPWEIAKSFDGACPLSDFVPYQGQDMTALEYRFYLNGELRQHGQTSDMLNPILPLIAHMSSHFTLLPGDVILTGTPKGVGRLHRTDALVFESNFGVQLQTRLSG
ncbi:MAG: fumarylacetoacetate hydrolase family protein [Hahellaceae bacterium]|nr:fumarylacetoacetate hydrolase family protein [Hahellaceae bacterium]